MFQLYMYVTVIHVCYSYTCMLQLYMYVSVIHVCYSYTCMLQLYMYVIVTVIHVHVCYSWAMIPLMYPFSRLFDVPSTALVVLKSVNIFLGTTATLATFILDFLQEDDAVSIIQLC